MVAYGIPATDTSRDRVFALALHSALTDRGETGPSGTATAGFHGCTSSSEATLAGSRRGGPRSRVDHVRSSAAALGRR
jgi:hypothetical protein